MEYYVPLLAFPLPPDQGLVRKHPLFTVVQKPLCWSYPPVQRYRVQSQTALLYPVWECQSQRVPSIFFKYLTHSSASSSPQQGTFCKLKVDPLLSFTSRTRLLWHDRETSDVKFFFIYWRSWANTIIQRTGSCSQGLFVLLGERCWYERVGRPFWKRRQCMINWLKSIAHGWYRPSTCGCLFCPTDSLFLWWKRVFQLTAKSIKGRVCRNHRQVWEGQLHPCVHISLLGTLQVINVKLGAAFPCF